MYDTGNPTTDLYYYLAKEIKIAGNASNVNPKSDYAANGADATWKPLENIGYVFARFVMANFGLIAGAVFSDNKLFSQFGKYNGVDSSDYQKFGDGFVPNLLLNWLTGKLIATDAEISGEVKGISGSFRTLNCVNNEGVVVGGITFGSDGNLWLNGDVLQQGRTFYGSDIRCRGGFGASYLNALVTGGSTFGYYCTQGMRADKAGYVKVLFTTGTSAQGQSYSIIPLYGTSGEASGFPVNMLHITSPGTERYVLNGYTGQEVTVINANDVAGEIYLYSNGALVKIPGGGVAKFINIGRTIMLPNVGSNVLGAGWVYMGMTDNNWA